MVRTLFKIKRFHERAEAGRQLAERLSKYANRPDVLVLGLPRGGIPVGFEIAQALNVPLDACLVRKLGVPGYEELAMGAVAMGGVRVLNQDVVSELAISEKTIDRVAAAERRVLDQRNFLYRQDRPTPNVRGRTVILVDDGLATGATMRAAVTALRPQGPARIVVAVPAGPPESCRQLRPEVDELICLIEPDPFYAIGLWYQDFSPVSDDTVRALLQRSREPGPRKANSKAN